MSNSPADEERLDHDPTDELPILLETAVLDPEEHRATIVVGDDDTGEHTAHFASMSQQSATTVDALKSDLAQRAAKIESLERDIARLSSRWLEIERHLVQKDAVIEDLSGTLARARTDLAERNATERRLATEIAERDAQLSSLLDELEQVRNESAARHGRVERAQRETEAALAQIATLRGELATAHGELTSARGELAGVQAELQTTRTGLAAMQAELANAREEIARRLAAAATPGEAPLREQLAALASYIDNRHAWWDQLQAHSADQAARIVELETEVAHRADRQQRAESLAERESERAQTLREDLVVQTRRGEALATELDRHHSDPGAQRTIVSALEAQLGVATQTSERLQRELASVREELAASRADQARHAAEDAAALAAAEQKAEAATRSAAAAVEQLTAAAARTDAATQPVEAESRAVAFEVMAQLEAEVEHRRALLTSEREAARDLERRLAAATADLDAARRQDAETRLQLDQARADAAQIERALIDKDRALEARDERIATLQAEIDEKLGALQKLNSMDLSLQGLESKMSDRLRRADTAVDQPNTPALVCLTSDVPRQYPLNKKTMTVGRSSQCDIQIVTQFVSREHARLAVGPRGTVVIEDLGSTNGVFVNAARVERQELRHGDLVTVGETQFRFLESMAH